MYDDRSLFIGMDVGSTTVKAVVIDSKTDEILWRDYQRHETQQPEVTIEYLKRIQKELDCGPEKFRLFIFNSSYFNSGVISVST